MSVNSYPLTLVELCNKAEGIRFTKDEESINIVKIIKELKEIVFV